MTYYQSTAKLLISLMDTVVFSLMATANSFLLHISVTHSVVIPVEVVDIILLVYTNQLISTLDLAHSGVSGACDPAQ